MSDMARRVVARFLSAKDKEDAAPSFGPITNNFIQLTKLTKGEVKDLAEFVKAMKGSTSGLARSKMEKQHAKILQKLDKQNAFTRLIELMWKDLSK